MEHVTSSNDAVVGLKQSITRPKLEQKASSTDKDVSAARLAVDAVPAIKVCPLSLFLKSKLHKHMSMFIKCLLKNYRGLFE